MEYEEKIGELIEKIIPYITSENLQNLFLIFKIFLGIIIIIIIFNAISKFIFRKNFIKYLKEINHNLNGKIKKNLVEEFIKN